MNILPLRLGLVIVGLSCWKRRVAEDERQATFHSGKGSLVISSTGLVLPAAYLIIDSSPAASFFCSKIKGYDFSKTDSLHKNDFIDL